MSWCGYESGEQARVLWSPLRSLAQSDWLPACCRKGKTVPNLQWDPGICSGGGVPRSRASSQVAVVLVGRHPEMAGTAPHRARSAVATCTGASCAAASFPNVVTRSPSKNERALSEHTEKLNLHFPNMPKTGLRFPNMPKTGLANPEKC